MTDWLSAILPSSCPANSGLAVARLNNGQTNGPSETDTSNRDLSAVVVIGGAEGHPSIISYTLSCLHFLRCLTPQRAPYLGDSGGFLHPKGPRNSTRSGGADGSP